ncbi:ArsA-related P-loop ATPase [Gephyromycinifex aptenodytis]|uniref:ArsA-related P-loop ATPase n=1 Tax=Gephyromycinifex aptenodytis TaxID=2716227 RepID=UPI001447CE19|nr:ArsA-related P-loop ATPase [Gephyromycinifex aptenodytis]
MATNLPPSSWADARLHVVTGKGGTGKTTVAAALALTLASLGRRVLIAEVEGRGGISQAFDVPPLPDQERLVLKVHGGGEVWGLAVEAKAALLEYLSIFYRLGRAGAALEKIGAIDFATTIAPGVRDVLLIGKVYEAVGRQVDQGRSSGGPASGAPEWAYDAVVLDAPPTGRVAHFLNVNSEVADLARVGPIRSQADSITRMLRSGTCVVHLTTLLEEMPVQETIDAVADLSAIGVPVGALIVNQAREEVFSPATAAAVHTDQVDHDAIAAVLERHRLPADEAVVSGLLAQGRGHLERIAVEDRALESLTRLGHPIVVLPHVWGEPDEGLVRVLAQHLAEQGLWS